MKNFSLGKFYLYSFVPYLFIFILLDYIGVIFLNKMFFSVAYIWHLFLITPGMRGRVRSFRYRFSMIRLFFSVNESLQKKFNPSENLFTEIGLKMVVPFVFSIVLSIFALKGNVLFSLLGTASFELLCFLVTRKIEAKI